MRHHAPRSRVIVVRVTPLVHAHLLAGQVDADRQTVSQVFPLAVLVYGNGSLMSVRHRPYDVLGPERGIAAKKDTVPRTHHGLCVDDRAVPIIEFDANIALDPRKRVVLPDRQDHVVTGKRHFVDDFAAIDTPVLVDVVFHQLKGHADELAVLYDEFLG